MEPNQEPHPIDRIISIPTAILIVGVMISASILYVGNAGTASIFKAAQNTAPTPTPTVIQNPSSLIDPTDPVLGSAHAKVTIVEFSDFQCPFCRQFSISTFGQIKSTYIDTGKVRLIYRDFPLSFHPSAKPAALAAQCAQEQGKFWEMHDKIFGEQQKKEPDPSTVSTTMTFTVADLKNWASQIGLNMAQFNSCFDSGKYNDRIDADSKAGTDAGVSGTPTFFINGQAVVGAQPFSVFQAAIDQALAAK